MRCECYWTYDSSFYILYIAGSKCGAGEGGPILINVYKPVFINFLLLAFWRAATVILRDKRDKRQNVVFK